VAANLLADAGWSVLVLEAEREPGGAVKSSELIEPGYVCDHFSAFYPLAAASKVIQGLELERHGLEWARAPAPVAHAHSDGRYAMLHSDRARTAASLDSFAVGDGDRWQELMEEWGRIGSHFVDALMTPFPPVRAGGKLAAALGRDLLRFVRLTLLPVRRLAEERFEGEGAGWLLAGNALHADLSPDSAAGGFYGLVLCGLGHQLGFPFPRGGAGQLTAALVRRFEAAGGRIEYGARAERVIVRRGRAAGVRLADGREVSGGRAVLADVTAPALYGRMLDQEHVPARLLEDLSRFQFDSATVKVDWTLDGPIPWKDEAVREAGTVHLADGMDSLTASSSEILRHLVPANPFLVLGQYAIADPTRAPEGKETAWGYTHVPREVRGDAGEDHLSGAWDERETEAFVRRVEDRVEATAPGFRDLIRGRHVFAPPSLEAANANLERGAAERVVEASVEMLGGARQK